MFENKNVLISGGSSGIGLSLAKQFFSLGSSITIIARRKNLLEKAKKEIERERKNSNQTVKTISADVSKYSDLKSALEKDRPAADILINSAGITYPGRFTDLNIDIYYDVMNVNYIGTINLTKLIVPEMIRKTIRIYCEYLLRSSFNWDIWLYCLCTIKICGSRIFALPTSRVKII